MAADRLVVGEVFEQKGISFTFSNLKNLASSDITYPEFLACVSQRLLLKQYAAQTMDAGNFLCPMSRTSDVFNKNKESFKSGINDLFLKPLTLSIINSQTSQNKVTKGEQIEAATEFVKWYDSMWFNRLKSEEFLNSMVDVFKFAEVPDVKQSSGDWKKLAELFSGVNENSFFNIIEVDSKVFINNASSIEPKWFDKILSNINGFMEMTGSVNLSAFDRIISDEDLILPTTSAFMISTAYGIEEIEEKKKMYNAPLDPYNMFQIFEGTAMSHLLKLNQFTFTLYNYFKILL